jgi:hypothetical protein
MRANRSRFSSTGVQLLEVVGSVEFAVPLEAQPTNVLLGGVDVLLLLLQRVRVIEAQIAGATELLGKTEVEADRLGVTDVQIAVGLGREARFHCLVLPRRQVLLDDGANEIGGGRLPRVFICHRDGLSEWCPEVAPGSADCSGNGRS